MKYKNKIYVTQPNLPPLEEFVPYLQEIWDKKILTNGGPFHQKLEQALCDYLGVNHLSLFTNGTIALITALQALKISGEVITTPYSFVATAHSLLWNGISPVFVDIDAETLNIDPSKIEAAITSRTSAIMPVHVYGRPCNVKEIENIAKRHNLKVIYDAAHAFGVKLHGSSLLNNGDLSILSFHATKVFNTLEGGAIICPDENTKHHIDQLKNFGFVDEITVVESGINGKMNEVNAALGLLQLQHIDQALTLRENINTIYKQELSKVKGIDFLKEIDDTIVNNAYYPILINKEYRLSRDELYEQLKIHEIYARRYFYPLISNFPMYQDIPSAQRKTLPVANDIASRILCLPIYPNLELADQLRIIKIIKSLSK
jgi:dTDP-4-amino-4,6-dideoxygalactose transaminase